MDKTLALFIDFENIARSVRQHQLEERVDLRAVLSELEGQGRLLVKRAYADWGYFKDYRSDLLQNGIEPVQVFAASRDREGWKNGADIRIAIDAIETAFRFPDITDFVIISGDSDFLSLVNRLRENGKMVWGVGLKSSSSQYLVKSCDYFLFYEEIAEWTPEEQAEVADNPRRDSRSLLLNTLRRMADRQGLPGMPPPGTPLKAGAVRAAMRRLDPTWDERFEGFGSFVAFVEAHADAVLIGRPSDSGDYFLAERGGLAEATLQRQLSVEPAPSAETPAEHEELAHAIRRALRALGSPQGRVDLPQRMAVRAAQLQEQIRQELPGFDETQYGCGSFLDLLLSLRTHFRVVRPELRSDVLVTERESPAESTVADFPEAGGNGHTIEWTQTPAQRYMAALRIRRIRHVPMEERYAIIRTLCRIFEEADGGLSLKEAKDSLHEWFEANDPSVPWDHVNNVVYHLFWTYCFEFGEGDDDVPLWDRPTRWSHAMETPEEVIRRCDLGLVRMISDVVGVVDPQTAVQALGDEDPGRLHYFEEVCTHVNQRFTTPALR
jgi:uncharacterized LabA/DUF88 family protein